MTRFEEFSALHYNTPPLLIGNVWNAQSARIHEQRHYKAIGTSSAAVAGSLGFNDGEEMIFDEYLFVIRRIAASTDTLLTVDLEAGYGDSPEAIVHNISRLHKMGVVGINIEDSVVVNGKRSIVDATSFAAKLSQISSLLNAGGIDMFINVRTDSFLLGLPNALEDALTRTALYQETGVHGLFFPCVTDLTDITSLTANSKLPVSVMCMPGLPDFDQLQQAGIKRISAGPFLNMHTYRNLEIAIEKIGVDGSFASLF